MQILFSLSHSMASPANYRGIEHTPPQKVTHYIFVSLVVQAAFIKTFIYDNLKNKRKFLEISKMDISNIHPGSWSKEITIEVCEIVKEQSDEAS